MRLKSPENQILKLNGPYKYMHGIDTHLVSNRTTEESYTANKYIITLQPQPR